MKDVKVKRERCFADRKDGTCHALRKKECKGCKFYCPRSHVYHNIFYKYSFENDNAFNNAIIFYKSKYGMKEFEYYRIMGEDD